MKIPPETAAIIKQGVESNLYNWEIANLLNNKGVRQSAKLECWHHKDVDRALRQLRKIGVDIPYRPKGGVRNR